MKVNGYYFNDESGAPFFWLADTAWNIWCRGTPEEWDIYLAERKAQGFNVVQFVLGWWRGCSQPVHGQPFEVRDGELVFDERAWESLDLLFAKIRAAGLIASPVMLWALTENDPGQIYTEEQCIEIARKQLARLDAPDVVWMLGGDGNYSSPEAEARWRRIGRAVFADRPETIATLHPCGGSWVGDAFKDESWYNFVAIQSGHGSLEADLKFLVNADYASAWRRIEKPFLNLEPNYEGARSYLVRKRLTAYHVRRAAYWSLLVAPPAGITYGISSIWIWARTQNEIAENHDESWIGQPWHEELKTEGALNMSTLRNIFERLPWTRLRPDQERLLQQPGLDSIEAWQVVAATPEGDCLIAYAPQGGRLLIDTKGLQKGLAAFRVDPVSGEWTHCDVAEDTGRLELVLPAGEESDSVVVLLPAE